MWEVKMIFQDSLIKKIVLEKNSNDIQMYINNILVSSSTIKKWVILILLNIQTAINFYVFNLLEILYHISNIIFHMT